MNSRVTAVIPARFKSSRFPGKVLATILGKSLLQRTYENAKQCHILDEIVIAVDDKKVFDHVTSFGGRAIMTSPDCINGSERAASILETHLPDSDVIVIVQADEPVMKPHVIESLVKDLLAHEDAFLTTPVIKIENMDLLFEPSVVKCVFDKNNRALYFSRSPLPSPYKKDLKDISFYRHAGLYCFRRKSLLSYPTLVTSPLSQMEDLEQLRVLEHGFPIYVTPVEYDGVEVNLPEDIKKVEEYLCKENTSLSPVA